MASRAVVRSTILAVLFLVVATMSCQSLSATAQDLGRERFSQFASVPGTTPSQTIRWQNEIAIEVFLLKSPQNTDGVASDLDELMAAYGLRRNSADAVIMSRSVKYAYQLANAAELKIGFTSQQPPTLSIRIVDQVAPVPSITSSSTVWTAGVMRQNKSLDRLCSLVVEWMGQYIQRATIEVWAGISVPDAERCVDDLVWRSFGFLGPNDPRARWSDEMLTQEQKLAMARTLYTR